MKKYKDYQIQYGEIDNNVVCPVCEKVVGAETFKQMKCEFCGVDLKSEVYKNKRGEFIAKSFQRIGKERK